MMVLIRNSFELLLCKYLQIQYKWASHCNSPSWSFSDTRSEIYHFIFYLDSLPTGIFPAISLILAFKIATFNFSTFPSNKAPLSFLSSFFISPTQQFPIVRVICSLSFNPQRILFNIWSAAESKYYNQIWKKNLISRTQDKPRWMLKSGRTRWFCR